MENTTGILSDIPYFLSTYFTDFWQQWKCMNCTKPQINTNSEHSFSSNRYLDDQWFSSDITFLLRKIKIHARLCHYKNSFALLVGLFHFYELPMLSKMLH